MPFRVIRLDRARFSNHLVPHRRIHRLIRIMGVLGPERQEGQWHHGDAQDQVEPVVRVTQGDEVGCGVVVDEEAVEEESQVDHTADEQEVAGGGGAAGEQDAGHAEEEVDDVVEDGDVEDPEQHRVALMAGELQVTQVRGDAGDESGDAHQEEDDAVEEGDDLERGAPGAYSGAAGECHIKAFLLDRSESQAGLITDQ